MRDEAARDTMASNGDARLVAKICARFGQTHWLGAQQEVAGFILCTHAYIHPRVGSGRRKCDNAWNGAQESPCRTASGNESIAHTAQMVRELSTSSKQTVKMRRKDA